LRGGSSEAGVCLSKRSRESWIDWSFLPLSNRVLEGLRDHHFDLRE
jgi:hypothetical protein